MAAVSHVGFGLGYGSPTHEVKVLVSALSSNFCLIGFTILEIDRFSYFGLKLPIHAHF